VSKTVARKPVYRMVSFWLSVLLVLYAFAGFVILPRYLESQIPRQLKAQMGWQVSVGNVSVDPFSLSVTVTDFLAKDPQGQEVVGFKRLYQNLSFWSLLRGVVDLQGIELEQPFVRVDLLKGYGVNFVRDWQQHRTASTGNASAGEQSGGGGGLPLLLSNVVIKDAHVKLQDFSQPDKATFDFRPVDINIRDLATYSSAQGQGQYQLTARMPDDQSIHWSGKLSLQPFSLEGTLDLQKVGQKLLWHFAAAHVPYRLQAGTLSLKTHFRMDDQDHFSLTTSQGSVRLKDARVAVDQAQKPTLTLASLDLNGIRFHYPALDLSIAEVSSRGLDLDLIREKSGSLNILAPLSPGQSAGSIAKAGTDSATTADGSGPALTWSIQHLGLSGSRVQWQDQTLDDPASIQLHDIDLQANGLSDKMDQPLRYSLKLRAGAEGQVSSQGELTPTPLTVHSQFSVSQLPVAAAQGYVQQYVKLKLPEGTVNASGKIDLDNQNDQLTGTVSSTLSIDRLKTLVAGDDSPLASWKSLKVGSIDINLVPAVINIGRISISQPQFDILRHANGQTNLANLIRAQKAAAPSAEPAKKASDAKAPVVRIDSVNVSGGEARFTDHAIKPSFSTRIHDLNGTVTGLSTVTPQKAKVSIRGMVDGYGKLAVDGTVGTLGPTTNTRLKLNLDNLALPPLSPYFGRYLGYEVSKGKLQAKVDYQLDGTRLDASNHLILDQLQLGKSVNSPDAVKAPVRLGLALMRDSKNQISLNVPVQGDLSDPNFDTAGVVFRTFVNLIAKAATSPFSILGSLTDLAGLTGEELSHVAFAPGQATPLPGQERKFLALAQALAKRPDLILNISAETAPSVDRKALQAARIGQAVTKQLGKKGTLNERIKVLVTMVKKQLGEAQFNALEQQRKGSDSAWAATLREALAQKVKLPDDALKKLADARAKKLQTLILSHKGVSADQLFLVTPDQNARVKDGHVQLTFGLNSR